MKIECTIPSCSKMLEGTEEEINAASWKIASESVSQPEGHPGRSHLGWCPDCAKKYSVE